MDQTKSETESRSIADAVPGESEAQVATTGENVLSLLRQATELAGGNSRYALKIAQRMSDELWAAQKMVAELQARVTELEAQVERYPGLIADLEAVVQVYRDKSERAELWLGKISSEIQERVLGSHD